MPKPKQIKPVGDTDKVRLLVYGAPGSGKTVLIGSAPKTLIVRPPIDHTASLHNSSAEEWVVDSWPEMDEVLMYMRHEGSSVYDWVWLDSISLLQKSTLDDIWETTIAEKPHRARYGLDKPEYGLNMDRLGRWVRYMSSSPGFDFGITAHQMWAADPANEDQEILMPFVQGRNMPEQTCGNMNVVAYLEIVKREGKADMRVLRTRPSNRYYAKDQFDAFGDDGRLVNPTMPKISKAIKAARGQRPTRRKTTTRRRATRRRKGGSK